MRLAALLVPVVVAVPAVASAHIELLSPAPRTLALKTGHCGDTSTPPSASPTVLAPGATITVTWKETVGHPGHYRISFDEDGQDFTVPLDFDDESQTENVLVDGIPDLEGTTTYSEEITLPDVECERCTLQVIQMMTDKAPYGDGNDLYFQCADLALREGTPVDPPADDEPAESVGGCAVGGDGAAFAFALGVLASIAFLARRRGVAHKRTVR